MHENRCHQFRRKQSRIPGTPGTRQSERLRRQSVLVSHGVPAAISGKLLNKCIVLLQENLRPICYTSGGYFSLFNKSFRPSCGE
eukprot:2535046-Rhodomonas_salina.1